MIKMYFVSLVSMTDTAIMDVLQKMGDEDIIASARLRVAIKKVDGLEFRRLKLALGYAVDQLALAVGNIPYMSDEELVVAFLRATPDQRADFIMELDEVTGENGERGCKVIATVQERLNAKRSEADRKDEEERAVREAARKAAERKDQLEHPEVFIAKGEKIDDAMAIAFIKARPWGIIGTEEQARRLITVKDDTEMVQSFYTGDFIPVSEAWVLGLMFVADEATVARLQKKLRGLDIKAKYHPFVSREEGGMTRRGTLEFLADRDHEMFETAARDNAFADEVHAALEPAATSYENLAQAYVDFCAQHAEGGQTPEVPEWKLRVINEVAADLEYSRVHREFVGMLREKFSSSMNFPVLDSFISELRAAVEAYVGPAKVKDKMVEKVWVAERHREWLKYNKVQRGDNVVPMRGYAADGEQRHTGKTARERDKEETERIKDARRVLKSINYDGLPESKRIKDKGGHLLFLDSLSSEQVLSEAKRLRGVTSHPKTSDTGGRRHGQSRK